MNKLKELETQYNSIKPPQIEMVGGVKLVVTKEGRLAIQEINNGNGALYLDANQIQILFDYLKNELKFE